MEALRITVDDLIWASRDDHGTEIRAIPMLRNRLGPGSDANLRVHRGMTPLPARLVEGLLDPVTARLTPDLALPRAVAANDVVLLDQNTEARTAGRGPGPWVVMQDSGLRVRYVRRRDSGLFIAGEGRPGCRNGMCWKQ